MIKFYLASRSPRRLEILNQIGIQPVVIESSVVETVLDGSAQDHTLRLAIAKAKSALGQLDYLEYAVVAGADTEVSFNKEIFGQPDNAEQAKAMLRKLSGNVHTVTTSICLIKMPENKMAVRSEDTLVTFRKLSDHDIDSYVNTGEPFDKAGGYGIQGIGALLVEKIDGCYFNVVGFPISKFRDCLNELNVDIWKQAGE